MRPGQRSSIRTDKAMPSNMLPGIESEPAGMQTTHFSVLDAEGNRVAATISVNLFFGTGYMPPKTGVLLNNTMDDFSTKPGRPNEFGLVGATAQCDCTEQAQSVEHVADLRRNAEGHDDHRLARAAATSSAWCSWVRSIISTA